MKNFYCFLLLFTLSTNLNPSFAKEGAEKPERESGGADVMESLRPFQVPVEFDTLEKVETYLNTNLFYDVAIVARELLGRLDDVVDQEIRKRLSLMYYPEGAARDGLVDLLIQIVNVDFEEEIYINQERKFAKTKLSQFDQAAPIIFDSKFIFESGLSRSTLVGIGFHEMARKTGVFDDDHKIGKWITSVFPALRGRIIYQESYRPRIWHYYSKMPSPNSFNNDFLTFITGGETLESYDTKSTQGKFLSIAVKEFEDTLRSGPKKFDIQLESVANTITNIDLANYRWGTSRISLSLKLKNGNFLATDSSFAHFRFETPLLKNNALIYFDNLRVEHKYHVIEIEALDADRTIPYPIK